jgi:hypothetical protein
VRSWRKTFWFIAQSKSEISSAGQSVVAGEILRDDRCIHISFGRRNRTASLIHAPKDELKMRFDKA